MGVIFRNGKPYGGAASSTDEIYYIDDKGNKITLTEEIEVLKQSCQYDLDSKIDKTEKGSKNGVAELDGTGKVPSDQLPSYVDDVIEGYYNSNDENFYLDEEYTENIKGEEGKIYIDLITNGSYRYAIKSNKFIKITSGYIGGKTDYGTIIIDGNSILLDQAVGMSTESHEYEIDGEVISSKNGAEIFNDYQHNIALGDYSHAEGSETIASGPYSHSEGVATVANTHGAHAEGTATTASGTSSHAEGNVTIASGTSSHAEGHDTVASATCSHAEGQNTSALGTESHAEGFGTKASGHCSHSEGIHTIASSDYQHVQGKYNVEDAEDKYAFIIGNGTSNDNRSNAIAIDWDGNILCYGDEISINEQIDNNTRKLSGIDDNANNYIHPTHTSHSKGMYKFANDGLGHVSDAEKVTKQDIVDLGIPGQDTTYTAGTGLSLSGTTINHKNSVAAKTTAGFLKLKYDAQGHITGSSPVTKSDFFDYGIPYVTVGYDGEYAYYFDYDEYGIPVKEIPDLTKNVDLKNIVQSFTVDESYFEAQKIGGRYKFTYKLPKDYLDNGFTLKFVICGTFEKESMILELTESCGVFTSKISTFSADRDPFTWADDPVFKVMYKISPDTINSDGERYLYLNISRLYLTYILSYQSIVGVCEFVNLDKDTLNYDESDMHESRIELLDRYYNATQSNPGLMSAKDKTKLDSIADSANNYVHPTTSGNKHIPSGGSSGKILRWSADGTAVWGKENDTEIESISNIDLENMLK